MLTISDQIAALMKRRGDTIKRMEALQATMVAAEGDEIREMTEDEQKSFDAERDKVLGIDKQLANLKSIETAMAAQAMAVEPVPGTLRPTPGLEVKAFKPFPGQAFVRYAMALARSKGNLMQAEMLSREWNDQTPEVNFVLKAAVAAGTTTDATWAAPLVQYNNMASEFIELLRARTVLDRIVGLRRVPFMTRIPRETAGASAGWVGEGLSKPVTRLSFDTLLFPFAKIACIIVITQELAKLSTPSAEALARDDMIRAIAEFMDIQFLDATVAPLANVRPGAITNGITPVASTGSTVALVSANIQSVMLNIANANIAMENPVWIMTPTAFSFLSFLRTAQDLFAFRDELVGQGKLMGIPVLVTTNIALAAGKSPIVLLDAAQVMYADDGPVTLDSSSEATLQLDSAPATPPTTLVSLWQQNMLGIKAERYVYWARRRDAAVQVISGFPAP